MGHLRRKCLGHTKNWSFAPLEDLDAEMEDLGKNVSLWGEDAFASSKVHDFSPVESSFLGKLKKNLSLLVLSLNDLEKEVLQSWDINNNGESRVRILKIIQEL